KRVDATFERSYLGKRRKYLLEAKNWSAPLNHSDLEKIYGGYASLLTTRKADELLIVAPQDLKSAAAKAFVRDTPNISYLSFKDFLESILGFHDYLATFVSNHETEGLEQYYV